ncbi:hypothetical protein BKA62DRAFT_776589 [Auriculariales sp. MPI-PUGE-AT-0066]|nr:hypothetical protein BKA62DRAFT_776589 [Auriculariales sp. MPI-PUGE-AT-0066]
MSLPPVIPITAYMLETATNCEDGSYMFNNVVLALVSVQGRVLRVRHNEITSSFEVNDSTGSLGIVAWNSANSEDLGKDIEEGKFYHFIGQIRTLVGRRCVSLEAYNEITNANQILFNICNTIHTDLAIKDSQRASSAGVTAEGFERSASNSVASALNLATPVVLDTLTPMHKTVYTIIRDNVGPEERGCHVLDIVRILKAELGPQGTSLRSEELGTVIDALIQDHGLVFTSLDDQYFFVADE